MSGNNHPHFREIPCLERVTGNCGCGENGSCYGCLRSYGNQFAHAWLKRGPVKDYLGEVLGAWVP